MEARDRCQESSFFFFFFFRQDLLLNLEQLTRNVGQRARLPPLRLQIPDTTLCLAFLCVCLGSRCFRAHAGVLLTGPFFQTLYRVWLVLFSFCKQVRFLDLGNLWWIFFFLGKENCEVYATLAKKSLTYFLFTCVCGFMSVHIGMCRCLWRSADFVLFFVFEMTIKRLHVFCCYRSRREMSSWKNVKFILEL